MARTRRKALWIGPETGYDAGPSGGSTMLYLPALSIGQVKDTQAILPTDYFTNRNWPTAPEVGAESWALDFELPLSGLATNAGVGAPIADDGYDVLFSHAFGLQTNVTGLNIASTTANTVTWDASASSMNDLFPIFDASITVTGGNRTQWQFFTTSGNNHVPSFVTNPTATAIGYSHKNYRFDDDGGTSAVLVLRQDDIDYALTGGRVTAMSITAEVGQIARLKVSMAGTTKLEQGNGGGANLTPATPIYSGMPTPVQFTRFLKTLLSPVWFDGTRYATRKIEVDFGITSAPLESTEAAQGRAGFEFIGAKPTIMIEPLYADSFNTIKSTPTRGRMLLQFGAGLVSGGMLNSCAIHCDEAQLIEADPSDDQGRVRQALKFQVSDPVINSGTATYGAVPIQMSRA